MGTIGSSTQVCSLKSLMPLIIDDGERRDLIEDRHHAIFGCSGHADAQGQYRDLFQGLVTTVRAFS